MLSKKMVALGATAGLIAAGLVPAAGQAATPSTTSPAKLQRALDGAVAAGIPGVVLLARNGDHTVRLTSGYADVEHKTRMRFSDRFRIGSVTKQFVATAALQLVGEGKLALDDTVESRLPGVVPNGAAITVRQLLNMRSGLFDYLNDGDKTVEKRLLAGDLTYRWSPLELVAIATRHEPHFAPDADWSYCNTCYVLLGQIIEGATGHRLGDELRERVFAPAGLRATSFDTEPRIAGPHAHGYEQLGSGALTDVGVISPSYAGAAGAIVSTAGDLARFHRELYRGHLLRPDLLNAMWTIAPMKAQYRGYGYGMGLLKQPMGCGSAYGHGGAIAGFLADAYSSRDAGRQAVVLANIGEDSISDRAAGALQNVLRSAYCAGR